jgi:predicted alpha/beta hydrolase family esterase
MAWRKTMKRHFILINGILNNPENVGSWTDLAEDWLEKNCPKDGATRFEYKSGVITRRLFQNDRVDNLEKIVERHYTGERIVLVGHSNGCDIIQRFLNRSNLRVHEVHLIAGACEASFDKNRLNKALHNGYVNRIICYVSPVDEALKKAKWSTRLLGWLGLGYGYLGLIGPQDVDFSLKEKVDIVSRKLSHSGWFNKDNFELTMRRIVGACL